jgi:hypothetical protein
MPHFSPNLLKVLPISPVPVRRAGLVVLMAVLLSPLLPQAAAATEKDGEQNKAEEGKSGEELYGKDVYWNATPNDVNNLLKTMTRLLQFEKRKS